jgi:type IV secretory pathway protease TraF
VLCLIVPLGVLAAAVAYVRLNLSPSLSYGLYRLHPVAHPLQPGMLVIVHVPGWSALAQPFLKPVAAVGGEWVCRTGHRLILHGEDYGPVYDAWRGKLLPSAVAEDRCAMVPPGHVFLASTAPQSLDSRYFGPIAISDVSALATPLLTWSTVDAATDH